MQPVLTGLPRLPGLSRIRSSLAIRTVETNSSHPPGADALVKMFEIDRGHLPLAPRRKPAPLQRLPAPAHDRIDKADYGYEK
jgi:hypothetical protein